MKKYKVIIFLKLDDSWTVNDIYEFIDKSLGIVERKDAIKVEEIDDEQNSKDSIRG